MSTWKIPGKQHSPASEPSALRTGQFQQEVSVETTDWIQVAARRADAPPASLENVADDDLLEIEFEGGVRQWILAEQFRKDFIEGPTATRGATRVDADGALLIDPQLRIGAPTRGVSKWAIKGLRRLKVKIGGKLDAPDIAAAVISAALEKKFMPDPGFKRWVGKRQFEIADDSSIDAEQPTLLFLHGTFSSTLGSFGDLREDDALWKALSRRYGDRIFTLDHHTISSNPLENALEVVKNLPPKARIDMVSHSRGGMIGELLCRGQRTDGEPFDDFDFKAILGDPDAEDERQDREKQLEQLRELDKLLRERTPRIERFVRVAAPAAGTSLASGRLDRWLSIFLNALKLVPGLAVSPTYNLVSSFTAAVLKKRLDPGGFPGIEAMRPASPLVRLLNRGDIETSADLTVISGDSESSGIWGSIKLWVMDLVYAGDHDIVVNTPSMYGGAKRSQGVYFFDHGSQVDHFHYFSNDRTAKKLGQGLAPHSDGDSLYQQRQEYGFLPLDAKRRELAEKQARLKKALVRGAREDKEKPVVYVLPGIMGSALSQEDDDIWVSPWRLALGQMGRLRIHAKKVAATQLLAGPYGDLIEHLSFEHAVKAFPYDWRLSLRAEAKRLAADVNHTLDKTEQPLRLLAHSLGGLLARVMFAENPELWKRFKAREGSRVVMLGTPNAGSFKIARVLLGKDKMLRLLSLVDLANSKREMVEIVSKFPGILELLPEHDDDYFERKTWEPLAAAVHKTWPSPAGNHLRDARKVRDLLRNAELDPERFLYVAGVADETPSDVKLVDGRLRFMATRRGDGSVPWDGGIPEGINAWYMNAEHGKLADHRPGFDAIDELLAGGDTAKLTQAPPAFARGLDEKPFEMTEDPIEAYPDEQDLQAAAVGYSFLQREPKTVEPLHLSVYHGDLRFKNRPVLAGHHEGDAILGAEWALDQKLDGRLNHRRDLGLYPGKIGSSEIVLNDPPADGNLHGRSGAIIVGLGAIGKLLPSGLEQSVTDGALRYAMQLVEERRAQSDNSKPAQPFLAPLCSLVIGSEFGGLSAAESIGAILKGVLRANDVLAEQGLADWVRIGNIEFIELYRDRAIQAAQILLRLRDDAVLHRHVIVRNELVDGESGRSRVPPNESAGWWHRVQIASGREKGSLSFTTMTGRARADTNVVPLQLENVKRFVDRAVTTPNWSAPVANTLFHMLLPNDLKPMALEERNLVLLLGTEAAAYPWELLHDQTLGETQPLVTRGGLIRQLVTSEAGRKPIDSFAEAALVVGNPPTHLAPLPGAEREALAVADQLALAGLKVAREIGSGADDIQISLFSRPYQVLHLAGHGVIDDKADKPLDETSVHQQHGSTGMVIGKQLYLTPNLIAQLPQVPELVFINCCHLGAIQSQTANRFNLLAANLGSQFIRDGVSAVVAAGWAVDDAAAATFAVEFYGKMLAGDSFGEAVKHARKMTYELHRRVNTFGAYQCYGDPSYRLRIHGRRGGSSRTKPNYVSPDHAAYDFDAIRQGVKAASSSEVDWAKDRIQRLDAWVRENRSHWLDSSAILNAAIGEAYREVEMFPEALEAYGRAIEAEEADAPVRILERRGNLLVMMGEMETDRSEGAKLIRQGIEQLESVLAAGETAERHSLAGGAYCRLHIVRTRKAAGDLEKMTEHYKRAYQLMVDQRDRKLAYPLLNWLSAELGRIPLGSRLEKVELDGKSLDVAKTIAEAREIASQSGPDFWSEIAPVDCRLVASLCDGSLLEQIDAIEAAYSAVRIGSPVQRSSAAKGVRVHLQLLRAHSTVGEKKKKKLQDDLVAALERIIKAVERD